MNTKNLYFIKDNPTNFIVKVVLPGMILGYFKNRRISKRAMELAHTIASLQSGDILMIHTKNCLLSTLIRKITKSYWNHTALILNNFAHLPEDKTTVVIEVQDGAVIAHRLGLFLDPYRFDIAIKRVPNLNDLEKDKVKHYLLSHIDTLFDSARMLDIVIGMFITGRVAKKFSNTSQVICSSLIQKAFYSSMPKEKKSEVIFAPDFKSEEDLDFVSPADIARSEKAVWIFNPRNYY